MQLFARCGSSCTVVLNVPQRGTFADVRSALVCKQPSLAACSDLCFSFGGRRCEESTPIAAMGLREASTVDVQRRLRGGGGDGGATGAESRVSYLEMYMSKKPDKVDPTEQRLAKWTRCQLSGEDLAPPCVADELGHLFNKDAVVNALVAKAVPASLGHISQLRHLIDLKLHRNAGGSGSGSGSDGAVKGTGNRAGVDNAARFGCPLTGLIMNGRFRFVVMRPSGHVVSERALKEIPAAVEDLIGSKWAAADVLPINGNEEEVMALRESLLASRAAEKAEKLAKKAAKKAGKSAACNGTAEALPAAAASPAAIENSRSSPPSGPSDGAAAEGGGKAAVAAAAAQLAVARSTAKKAAAQKWPKRDFEATQNASGGDKKKFKALDYVPQGADKSVYASIFTSSNPAPERETYAARSIGARFI